MNDRIGQQVGNYRIVRLLGQGGFAEVYLGEHRYLKSHAALKVLRISLKDEEAKRFLAEAQTLVRLTHPNIVRVLEFAVERGTPVLVMDYAPGGTARQRFVSVQAFALALERASQEGQADSDDDSEVTASLKPFWRPSFARSSDGALPESDIPQGVFLAASSTDDAFTARLKADLEERGIIVWNDRLKSAQNKLDQEDVLRQEIRAAQFVVVPKWSFSMHSYGRGEKRDRERECAHSSQHNYGFFFIGKR